jgi:hypothetical protein
MKIVSFSARQAFRETSFVLSSAPLSIATHHPVDAVTNKLNNFCTF